MEEILRFQENMLLFRRTFGWTADEVGDKIGVTRQTINNLEKNNRNKFRLNKTQYIAMRSVLDAEIARCPEETETLQLILDMLVDHPEKYSTKDVQALLDKINMVAPSILAGTATRKAVSKEILKTAENMFGVILAVSSATVGFVVSYWLDQAMKSDK